MDWLVRIVIAAVVTVGLAYAGHALWTPMEDEIKGTFLSDFKYLPIILIFFLALSLLDVVARWLGRTFSPKSLE